MVYKCLIYNELQLKMFMVTFIIMTAYFQYILTCKAVANCDKDGNGFCEIYSY